MIDKWQPIETVSLTEVVDLWGRSDRAGLTRWPDCWWGPTFAAENKTTENGWYCRLGPQLYRVYPTHWMFAPQPPQENGT